MAGPIAPRFPKGQNIMIPGMNRALIAAFFACPVLAGTALAAELPREVRAVDGAKVRLAPDWGNALVLVFYSTECPISNAASPELIEASRLAPREKLTFVGICVDPDLTDREIAQHAKEYALDYPIARDRRGTLAKSFGISKIPEAVVLDAGRAVAYQGRVDDTFAARMKRNLAPQHHDLKDAIAAVLAGKAPASAKTEPIGCPLPDPSASPPAFADEVALILERNCQSCHRPGQIGPFPLLTYEQAKKRADDIARVAEDRLMPPWKPDPHFGVPLLHDGAMTDDEIDALVAWAEAGAPLGEQEKLPPPASFPEGWGLGTPDLVLEMSEEYAVPAAGDDIYRCFVLPTNLPKDVYVAAYEYQPGNPRVVHHMLGYVDATGEGRKRDEQDPGYGYTNFNGPGIAQIHSDLGGWAPGIGAQQLPDGIGRSVPAGSDVIVQVHYHPNGKPQADRSRVGLYFARKPIKQTLHWAASANHDFVLKPHQEQEVKAAWKIPTDVEAIGVVPHMHLLGKSMTMRATLPPEQGGRTIDLIRIPAWDFNWQSVYSFAEPIKLPKGTVIRVDAAFNNTTDREVTWGEATTDEMCIGFIGLVKEGQDLTRPGEKDDLIKLLHPERSRARKPSPGP